MSSIPLIGVTSIGLLAALEAELLENRQELRLRVALEAARWIQAWAVATALDHFAVLRDRCLRRGDAIEAFRSRCNERDLGRVIELVFRMELPPECTAVSG